MFEYAKVLFQAATKSMQIAQHCAVRSIVCWTWNHHLHLQIDTMFTYFW